MSMMFIEKKLYDGNTLPNFFSFVCVFLFDGCLFDRIIPRYRSRFSSNSLWWWTKRCATFEFVGIFRNAHLQILSISGSRRRVWDSYILQFILYVNKMIITKWRMESRHNVSIYPFQNWIMTEFGILNF